MNVQKILAELGIEAVNPGACWGPEYWSETAGKSVTVSDNPPLVQSWRRWQARVPKIMLAP